MDSVPDLTASGTTRKTTLTLSVPISTLCTSVRITSRLRSQSASKRSGPMVAESFSEPLRRKSYALIVTALRDAQWNPYAEC